MLKRVKIIQASSKMYTAEERSSYFKKAIKEIGASELMEGIVHIWSGVIGLPITFPSFPTASAKATVVSPWPQPISRILIPFSIPKASTIHKRCCSYLLDFIVFI
jgi:hypothetical protein